MKVYIYYKDTDNSCGDPDCCGGPSPSPHIKVFSSVETALAAGHKKEELTEVIIDNNELVDVVSW